MDLKGAYTLLSLHRDSVHLFGMELSNNIIVFFLGGVFGWTGTPFAFQVLTRSILFEPRPLMLSKCVCTGVHTFGRTFTLAMYGVLYQCDSGYVGIRGET